MGTSLRANGACQRSMLGQEDAGSHRTPAGSLQPLGCLTCDRPGDPHVKGLCSCSTAFRRRLPVGTDVLRGPLAFSPTASLPDVCSPVSGEASPASGRFISPVGSLPDPPDSPEAAAATSAMLPGPGQLQNVLMFGAATPRAASQPETPASSQGGPAQGPYLHALTQALHSPPLRHGGPWSGCLRREVREEDIQHEVEALRIEMGRQDMPSIDGAEGDVLAPADLVADTALLSRQKGSDTLQTEDFDDVHASSAHQPEDCPIGAEGAASSTAGPGNSSGGISEQQRAQDHLKALQTCYAGFRCNCSLATTALSCLDAFSRQELQAIFYQVYPRSADGITLPHVAVSDVRTKLLQLMWNMKRPVPRSAPGKKTTSEDQRVFCIPRWTLEKLDGTSVEVCREAWKRAVGGSGNAHRMMYSMVLRGHSPAAAAGEKSGSTVVHKLLAGLSTAEIGLQARKHNFAVQWWLDLLKVMCFMPNERKILIRGPSYTFYHDKVYKPVAVKVGLFLARTAWYQCLPDALTALAATLPGDGDDPKPLRASRCAKHSRFPECSTCVSTRDEYLAASRNPGTPPEVGETLMSSSP